MKQYKHRTVEAKWQAYWLKNKTFRTELDTSKPKYYALDMFPFPSGAGLHVGHPVGYVATDIISRKKRHEGYNVLHPMGWDAFGLPAENYAIKTGVHPSIATQENINNFRRQIQSLGFSYDWEREVDTTDPKYYRWTQWLFLQFYKRGLLYEDERPMNWCPACKVVVANEEVEEGKHERCSTEVDKKNLRQWMFRITQYADRLLDDLNTPNFYLLHGWGGAGKDGWFKPLTDFFEEKNMSYKAPDFPNTEMPNYADWKAHFEKEVPKLWSQDVCLGHSLGCTFLLRYISENDVQIENLILVAPACYECADIPEVANFFHEEKRGQKCCAKDNCVGPTLFDQIIEKGLRVVKKKKNGKHKFSSFKKVVSFDEKQLIFDGELLVQHFNQKSPVERRMRMFMGRTVAESLDKLVYVSETVGYFASGTKVFCVVLSKVDEKTFIVKTFYESQKMSRLWQGEGSVKKSVFDFEKIKASVEHITIISSDNDEYISETSFDKLAEELEANQIVLPGRGHFGQSSVDHFPEVEAIFTELERSTIDWSDKIKAMQRNWIGKSQGAEVDFQINGEVVKVFTTRPDTLFGSTYFVLSPEHPLVSQITIDSQMAEVEVYQQQCASLSDIERQEQKEKTGVFTGAYAVNPINNEKIPVWIADYVMMGYGTGAIMAVPAHDERDFEFAKKYKLAIKPVVVPTYVGSCVKNWFAANGQEIPGDEKEALDVLVKAIHMSESAYSGHGQLIHSDKFDGKENEKVKNEIVRYLEKNEVGEHKTNYKLRDWIFTRQRYWGEPIPLINCENCGVVPHDPQWAQYKKEEYLSPCGGGRTYVATAKSSFRDTIIPSVLEPVKQSEKQSLVKTSWGSIQIDTGYLRKHFASKRRSERSFRFKYLKYIPQMLEKAVCVDVEGSILAYGRARNKIFRMVLEEKTQGVYFLKTFYEAAKITKTLKRSQQQYTLPLRLPETANYEPSSTGESPLAKMKDWVDVSCPCCGGAAQRETSTMPNWAGSNWYWLRYMDANNEQEFCSKEAEEYFGPVDLYVGGAEHAVLHLLYSRFWHKVLYDMGLVSTKEPFKKLVNQGLVMAEDGSKMSKSLGNVINPDEIVEEFGADTLRCYEMFMGPFEQSKQWNEAAVAGMRKFLDKIWRLFEKPFDTENEKGECPTGMDPHVRKMIHSTVKKVTEDIEEFKFNTALSQCMIFVNEAGKWEKLPKQSMKKFIMAFSPFAPHLCEEIWNTFLGGKKTLEFEPWPTYDEQYLVEDTVTYAVQVNGKLRADFEIAAAADKETVLAHAKTLEKIQKYLDEGAIRKEIFVPGKIVGFVVK